MLLDEVIYYVYIFIYIFYLFKNTCVYLINIRVLAIYDGV